MMDVRNALWLTLLAVACTSGPTGGGGPGAGPGTGPGTGPGPMCPLTTFTPSPGLEACFNCMLTNCCAEMQACDRDADCAYCVSTEGQIDTSARCIDPNTFSVYPNRAALGQCQMTRCVPPCGVPGGGGCTPSNCARSCPNFSSGCR